MSARRGRGAVCYYIFFSSTQNDAPHEWKMALVCTVPKWQLLELVTAPLGFYCFCCYNYSNCFKLMCVRVCPSQRNEWKLRSLRYASEVATPLINQPIIYRYIC